MVVLAVVQPTWLRWWIGWRVTTISTRCCCMPLLALNRAINPVLYRMLVRMD